MAETPDLRTIECPLCPERFESPLGDMEKIVKARKQFEEHMDKAHQHVLREGWGWVPRPKQAVKK